ncbi:ead/Ea22-like family protein, partial [Escherichia coli]|nr:ead/Ea22-like family protein [Escherichia coli]EFG1176217.1 ead/Ea22-like family protein [Escherichia coli]
MSEINSQALREAAEQAMHDDWGFDADLFHELVTPSIVLALLDERESQNKRIAELEKSEEQLINERDHAESALDDMYFA